jgi:exonuclease I
MPSSGLYWAGDDESSSSKIHAVSVNVARVVLCHYERVLNTKWRRNIHISPQSCRMHRTELQSNFSLGSIPFITEHYSELLERAPTNNMNVWLFNTFFEAAERKRTEMDKMRRKFTFIFSFKN